VASLRGTARTAPGDTLQGVTPDLKLTFLWLNLERTLDKGREKMGVVRRRQLKKVITFRGDDKKVVRFFSKKNRVTVGSSGTTVSIYFYLQSTCHP